VMLVPVCVMLVPVVALPPAVPLVGVVQVAARQRVAWTPLLVTETAALVPVVPDELQVPRAQTPAWIPPLLVPWPPAPPPLVLVVWVVVTAAGGGVPPGGDSAAWAAVWLSRNIPPAPAARIRPRWMMFMTRGFPSQVMTWTAHLGRGQRDVGP
jgi:hypothetical protein